MAFHHLPPNSARKKERKPKKKERKKKKKREKKKEKKFRLESNDAGFICAGVSSVRGYEEITVI